MVPLLAGAAIWVATAAAVSLLMALPAAALVETAGEHDAASRARIWLAALALPPLAGMGAAAWALWLHGRGIAASPHLGGLRPHLCLLPMLHAPAGATLLSAFAWLSLLLMATAVLRAVGGAVSGHLLRRMMVESGGALPGQAASGPRVLAVDLRRPTSFTAGVLHPVIVISTALSTRLTNAELAAIVAHERAHAHRRDNLLGLLADAFATLLLPLPTVWHYRRGLRAATEAAADDEAMAGGAQPEALRAALATVERAVNGTPHVPSLGALLIPEPALPAQRRERLRRMHERGSAQHSRPGPARALIAAAVGLAVVVALLLVAGQPVEDSLFCWAEQLMAAVR
ncbi:MAG: M56 family metallopeptidase [Armatimonadota bacterium]